MKTLLLVAVVALAVLGISIDPAVAQLMDKKALTLAAAEKMMTAASLDVAIGKAQTSAALKRPTKAIEDVVAGGRTAILGIRGITPLQGGLPIVVAGKVIGAIGVSGVTSQQDEQVARAGVDALAQ